MNTTGHASGLDETRRTWDAAAADFDQEPDHGLHDPGVRQAWTRLLEHALGGVPGRVLDIGCGTGSLSLILAQLGHAVTGADLSRAMLTRARAKADRAGAALDLIAMDAAFPALVGAQFDAVVCRHVLWALPEPRAVLERWAGLLKPGGRLALIEGRWHTGAGFRIAELLALLPPEIAAVATQNLSQRQELWGGAVADERYLLIGRKTSATLDAADSLLPGTRC